MNQKTFLPIGTVVLLKNADKRIMISGYCMITEGEINKLWDYCGYIYPEGTRGKYDLLTFDHEQIDRICYMGLEDVEEKKYANILNEVYEKSLEQFEKNFSDKTKETLRKNKGEN